MKKITILFLVFFIFIQNIFSENLFSFSGGIQSGFTFYGDKNIKSQNDEIGGKHILAGALANLNINPFNQVTFFAGADFLCDFFMQENFHSNHLHIDFPFGVKIYPGLKGLCFGLAYTFGFRYDFINTIDENYTATTPWGNGAKLILEYNFAHSGKSKFLPTLGCSWKILPRGNNSYDNILSAFIMLNF